MKCHYEVLQVERQSSAEEIKKSYRKLALQWHPDKNPERIEECTRQFALIQQAYDVLSDPQERAWYDRHREQILKGGLGDDYKDDSLDVFQFFTASCYSGFGDDDQGFYTVYRHVFEALAAEDVLFLDAKNKEIDVPLFGKSDSSYEEIVHPFYAYWQSYCTAKSYTWVEKYDIRDAPNRRILRLMEKENKKLRDKAKKERNEAVRALAAFVRKRDKRVQAYRKQLEEKAAENKRQVEIRRAKQRQERLHRMRGYEEADWSSMNTMEQELKEIENRLQQEFGGNKLESPDKEEIGDSEEELDSLFCVACNKAFRSDKAFENHERSKKHKENVTRLKEAMLAEEESSSSDSPCTDSHEQNTGNVQVCGNSDDSFVDLDNFKELEHSNRENFGNTCKEYSQQGQSDKDNSHSASEDRSQSHDDSPGGDSDATALEQLLAAHTLKKREGAKFADSQAPVSTDDDNDAHDGASTGSGPMHVNDDNSAKSKARSKKQKKRRRQQQKEALDEAAAAAEVVETLLPSKDISEPQKEDQSPKSLNCQVCNAEFPSRNKLFAHISDTGHAALKTGAPPVADKSTTKKKSKKKGKR